MLIYGFKNYEEFKELFAMKVNDEGVSYRRNKILLGFLKAPSVHQWVREHPYFGYLLKITDMTTLYGQLDHIVRNWSSANHLVSIMGRSYWSDKYATDDRMGICEDCDYRMIRYESIEHDHKIYKKKIGKIYKSLIEESTFGKYFPESTVKWMCEEMTRKWEAYAATRLPHYTLHVDKEFGKIYNSTNECRGYFQSCMQDRTNYHFYENAVDANAAYLTDNRTGEIIARCIVFNDVYDEGGKHWRLAERQYATDGDEILKRALVYALIQGGYIDGYKKVGVDCHANTSYEDNDGNSLSGHIFRTRVELDYGDTLSYQDTFIYYDKDVNMAYNVEPDTYCYRLDDTNHDFESNEEWDEYHQEYTRNNVVSVSYHGRWISCDENDLDDFVWVEGEREYYHEDDVCYCDECRDPFVSGRGYFSELTEEEYCCETCRDRAEEEYKSENWFWSEYDQEYYEDKDDVVEYHVWSTFRQEYRTETISVDSLEWLINDGYVVRVNGEYYNSPEHAPSSSEEESAA